MTGKRRSSAFDPARLNDELDDLLPPPGLPALSPLPVPASAHGDGLGDQRPGRAPAADAGPQPQRERAPRQAGRPGAATADPGGTVVTAVRIPKPLYDAVVGDLLVGLLERPSYAQIVAWTCEDRFDDVVTELRHAVTADSRAPRGRRLATDGVPLSLRFRPDERRALDAVMAELSPSTTAATRVTRTAAVAAALRVAVKHGLPNATSAA